MGSGALGRTVRGVEALDGFLAPDETAEELCWRHARHGWAIRAIVRCAYCTQWVCRGCFDPDKGICRTCAAEEWADGQVAESE